MPPLPMDQNGNIDWNRVYYEQGRDEQIAHTQNANANPYEAGYRQDDTERLKRAQEESDREYKLRAKGIKQEAEKIAIQRGQAEATRWYNEQMVQLAKDKLTEDQRQFDLNFGEQQRQYNQTFGENQRQFNIGASGYMDNGSPTLERDRFNDNSLFQWTGKAIELGSRPEDWVNYLRYTRGVGNNLSSIPGLSWTVGGQLGNTTGQGAHPTSSLVNVMGAMNIGGGGNWASQAAQGIASGQALDLSPSQQQIYQTANEFSENPAGAAPGWWEQQDPLTRSLIEGASKAQGHDWSTVMSRYNRSRWGAGSSQAA